MTLAPSPAALPAALAPLDDTHPARRIEYRDSDHSYRVRSTCSPCIGTGRVPGAIAGKSKNCPKCKGEGARFDRVPSVTTVLAELNKPALVDWSARMAADAVLAELMDRAEDGGGAMIWRSEFDEIHEIARRAHRTKKDEAAEIGTRVHDWITESPDILGEPLPDDPALVPACMSYREWWAASGFTADETERIVVDARQRYAGRFDLLVRDPRGRLWILDVKTSNSVYLEHVLQLSAYATALRQEIGESIAGTIVVWCHKDGRPVRPVVRTAREYRADFRVFATLLGVYEHRKTLGGELRRIAKEAAADAEFALPVTV